MVTVFYNPIRDMQNWLGDENSTLPEKLLKLYNKGEQYLSCDILLLGH
ncbi:MAG: hypothetical protein ABSE39_11515 [Candidatus Bathyarchaeia archaeon]